MPNCPKCGTTITCSVTFSTNAPPSQASQAIPTADVSIAEVRELLESIDYSAIDPASTKFVDDIFDKVEKYGDRLLITLKQLAWLRKLARV